MFWEDGANHLLPQEFLHFLHASVACKDLWTCQEPIEGRRLVCPGVGAGQGGAGRATEVSLLSFPPTPIVLPPSRSLGPNPPQSTVVRLHEDVITDLSCRPTLNRFAGSHVSHVTHAPVGDRRLLSFGT